MEQVQSITVTHENMVRLMAYHDLFVATGIHTFPRNIEDFLQILDFTTVTTPLGDEMRMRAALLTETIKSQHTMLELSHRFTYSKLYDSETGATSVDLIYFTQFCQAFKNATPILQPDNEIQFRFKIDMNYIQPVRRFMKLMEHLAVILIDSMADPVTTSPHSIPFMEDVYERLGIDIFDRYRRWMSHTISTSFVFNDRTNKEWVTIFHDAMIIDHSYLSTSDIFQNQS